MLFMMLAVLAIGAMGGYWGGSQRSDAFTDKTNWRAINPLGSSDTPNRSEQLPTPLENANDPYSASPLKAAENGSKLVRVDDGPETIRNAPPAEPKTTAAALKGSASLSVNSDDADRRPKAVKPNPLPASKSRAKDTAAEEGFENERPPDPVEMLMQKARGHHRQNRYIQAIRYYEEVLKIKPQHFEATFNLAAAHIAAGQYAEAHPLLEEAKRLQPDNAEILLNQAIVAIGTGRTAEAFSLLQDLERRKPEARFEICMHRGAAYSVLQEYEQALQWYDQALALNPHHLRLLFNMAVVYDSAQRFPEAIRFYGLYLQKADTVGSAVDPTEKKQIEKRMRYLSAFAAIQ